MSSFRNNVRILALSILGGRWDRDALSERLERALDGGPPDPRRLASQLMFHFDRGQPPTRQQLMGFLLNENALHRRLQRHEGNEAPKLLLDSPVMGQPPDNMLTYPLPPIATVKDLRLWLGLFEHELAWFADIERRQSRVTQPRLHHYGYRWVEKRSGSLRLIEIPKHRLKAIQRQIAGEILNRVPPHTCAQGFCRGRSIRSFVSPHVGKPVLLYMEQYP